MPNHLIKSSNFRRKGDAQVHVESVHFGIKRFECPDRSCSYKATKKVNLKNHVLSVHRNVKRFRYVVAGISVACWYLTVFLIVNRLTHFKHGKSLYAYVVRLTGGHTVIQCG